MTELEFAAADLAIALVLLVSAVFGVLRGLVKEVLSLAIWCLALLLGIGFGGGVGRLLASDLGPTLQGALGFFAVFVVVLVAGAFVQRFVGGLVASTGLSGTDRTLGFVFGAARGVAVMVVALIVLRPFAADRPWWQSSQFVGPLMILEEDVLSGIHAVFDLFGQEAPVPRPDGTAGSGPPSSVAAPPSGRAGEAAA